MPYILALGYAALCVILGSIAHSLGLPRKYSRKIVHLLVGAEWFILYHTAYGTVHFPLICFVLTAMLLIDYKTRIFPAITSDSDNAPGTVYYGLGMTVLAIVAYFYPPFTFPFGIGVMCTSVGDGFAGIFGHLSGGRCKLVGNKTLAGTLANFLSSSLASFALSHFYGIGLTAVECIMIGLLSAGAELLSRKGIDNITVPLSVSILAHLFIIYPSFSSYALCLSALPLVVGVIASRRALTPCAIAFSAILALASSLVGNSGFVFLILYFALAKITDKIKFKGDKSGQKSDSARGMYQVICNGAVSFFSVLLYFVTNERVFVAMFAVGLCESLADTAASGIGVLDSRTYDIFRLRRCESGESGGVSLTGSISAIIFAFALSLLGYALGILTILECCAVALSALLGVTLDTFLGSVAQPRYQCPHCGRVSEQHSLCGVESHLIRGLPYITNCAVNLISSVFAALCCLAVYLVF